MEGNDPRETLRYGVHGHYFFDQNADERRRLDHQFHAMRDDFDLWFDQALRMGGLSTDPERAGWSLLDVGCGEGQYGLRVVERYPKARVVGVDVDPDAIQAATRASASHADVGFSAHDMREPLPEALRLAGGFQVALVWFFIYFLPYPRRTLEDIARALAPGGVVLFCNVQEGMLRHPDPVVQQLVEPFVEACRLVGMFEVERNLEAWLGELGFEETRTATLAYPLGGATAHGRRWWAVVLGVLAGARRAIVEVRRLMPAREFDEKLELVASRAFVHDPGELRLLVTTARKA